MTTDHILSCEQLCLKTQSKKLCSLCVGETQNHETFKGTKKIIVAGEESKNVRAKSNGIAKKGNGEMETNHEI